MFPSVIPPTHSALSSLDVNECKEHDTCGANATCFNTNGSYYCTCNSGFALKSGASSFTGTGERCEGKGNTKEIRNKKLCSHFWICGFASCFLSFTALVMTLAWRDGGGLTNTCIRHRFVSFADICSINKTICGNGTCHPTPNGHLCACHKGFTNYFDQGAKCISEYTVPQLFFRSTR